LIFVKIRAKPVDTCDSAGGQVNAIVMGYFNSIVGRGSFGL
jgi:hypothetical protein